MNWGSVNKEDERVDEKDETKGWELNRYQSA